MPTLDVVDGSYRSPARRLGLFARLTPSLVFYLKYLWIVIRSVFLARRGKYDHQRWAESSVGVLRALESVGVKFEITGIDEIRKPAGACIVAGNHMSTLETMILPGIIEPIRRHTYVVKRPLLEYPLFKHVMRSRDPVAVGQVDPREDLKTMLEEGVLRLQQGVSMVVFPQSRRAEEFVPGHFNSIAVKLARRADVPIVPMALDTSAWRLGRIVMDFGKIDNARKVRLAFGEPLEVTGRGAEQQAELLQFITSKLAHWEVHEQQS